ncbi:malignant T-cell-amplified sequence 1 [Python bivittatus]|uniref:Malignant T-cell-amplified sequence 1 n=1 Tax=Python bivittatus TaxID=176946 RepID=A0A9F2WDD4_PYTBI|nr:malignant T-cell-amplified sequence 1 [Python bivittatus]
MVVSRRTGLALSEVGRCVRSAQAVCDSRKAPPRSLSGGGRREGRAGRPCVSARGGTTREPGVPVPTRPSPRSARSRGDQRPVAPGCSRFDEKENVSNCIQLKTSVIKGIKNQLIDQFPGIEPWLNQIMPKKDPVKIVRCHEHIEILTVNGELLFFRQREGPFYPTLRLLHKYPFILPHQQVDKGAIKFVLSGANIMCPGLTSPGAKLYPAAADTIVAIMAEGKQHALCVGVMKISADDIEKVNKGIGIENIHYLNDGLWHMKTYK